MASDMPASENPSRYRIVQTLNGEMLTPPPIWLMRQAGRYLPEYRKVRADAGSFLDLCFSPQKAAEVTLQPIRRFNFDAAILFSDILIVPFVLGQDLKFVEGEGPRLDPITQASDLAVLDFKRAASGFDPIYETVARVRAELDDQIALIGFAGSPWTVATYMVAGHGTSDQAPARLWAYRDPQGFRALIDTIVQTTIAYLSGQIRAGANLIQLFDSWSGSLSEPEFENWVIEPTRRIVQDLRGEFPEVPIIGFPKGAGYLTERYVSQTQVDGVGCDTQMPLDVMADVIPHSVAVQGNLDPLLLAAGGDGWEKRVSEIVERMAGRPFIFNLGHGIIPQTPIAHVERLVATVRGG